MKKKSALIFTASFGYGHVQAAKVLQAECKKNDVDTTIIDLLFELHPFVRHSLTFTYYGMLMYAPSIWRKLYRQKGEKELLVLHKMLSNLMQKQLYQYIQEHKPAFIISTHPFVTIMLAALKQKRTRCLPLYAVMTDFKFHPFFLHPEIDHYFTADPQFGIKSEQWGIAANKATYSGIPATKTKMNIDVRARNKGKSNQEPIILIAGGGQGLMHYKALIQALNDLQQKSVIICMIGKKVKLEESINKLRRRSPHDLHVIPFTEQFSSYLHRADIVITKAGGLTLTEALLCDKPMLIFKPLPGHEEDNAKFLLEAGACEWTNNAKEIPSLIGRLLQSESARTPSIEATHLLKKPTAAHIIVKKMLEISAKSFPQAANDAVFFAKDEQNKKRLNPQAKQVK